MQCTFWQASSQIKLKKYLCSYVNWSLIVCDLKGNWNNSTILRKFPNIKFSRNRFIRSRIVSCVRTERLCRVGNAPHGSQLYRSNNHRSSKYLTTSVSIPLDTSGTTFKFKTEDRNLKLARWDFSSHIWCITRFKVQIIHRNFCTSLQPKGHAGATVSKETNASTLLPDLWR